MYLNEVARVNEKYLTKLGKECTTYGYGYVFWREHLLERVQRLFVWHGLGDNLPQKEIDMPLYLNGHVGICHYQKELTAFNGTFSGVTKYIDEYTDYNCFSPVDSFVKRINKDIIVINNTSLRNPLLPLIHHYAVMLAHTELTLVNSLINIRSGNGIPIAKDEMQKKSIENYYNSLYRGKFDMITDKAMLGVEFGGGASATASDLKSIMEVRRDLIKSFYQAIGVRGAFEKNNNSVVNEVTSDSGLLQLNLHDMLECRQEGCRRVNDLFGTNWSVEIAPEIVNVMKVEEVADNGDNSKTNVPESTSNTDKVIE